MSAEEYAAGLRQLADLIEALPDVRLPHFGNGAGYARLVTYLHDREQFLQLRDRLGSLATQRFESESTFPVVLTYRFGALHLKASLNEKVALTSDHLHDVMAGEAAGLTVERLESGVHPDVVPQLAVAP